MEAKLAIRGVRRPKYFTISYQFPSRKFENMSWNSQGKNWAGMWEPCSRRPALSDIIDFIKEVVRQDDDPVIGKIISQRDFRTLAVTKAEDLPPNGVG